VAVLVLEGPAVEVDRLRAVLMTSAHSLFSGRFERSSRLGELY
jgi:hypothetical protein